MIKRVYITLIFASLSVISFAQKAHTFENWTSGAVQLKSNNLTFTAEEGWRVREFYLSRQTYTDLNLSYKVNKMFQFSGGYRLILKPHLFSVYEANSRFYADATGTYDAGDLSLSMRIRIQHTSLGQEDDFQLPSETYFRNRIRARYKINDMLQASVGYEMLLIMAPGLNLITENRPSIDLQIKLNKKNSITVGYLIRSYIQVEDPMNIHVMGVDYVYKF